MSGKLSTLPGVNYRNDVLICICLLFLFNQKKKKREVIELECINRVSLQKHSLDEEDY